MQALLNDIELDIQELKLLIEVISREPDSFARNVAKRNIIQTRSRLDLLLEQLEEGQPVVSESEEVAEPIQEMELPLPTVEVAEINTEEAAIMEPVEPEIQSVATVILADRIKTANELRSSISLNDSFRFSREVFGNDTELMNRVLQQIGEMSSLEMALAFVRSKVNVDEENEAMADFMELLRKYFN